ncbi:MAG: hemolysin family protein [Pseudomonadota bacterium]
MTGDADSPGAPAAQPGADKARPGFFARIAGRFSRRREPGALSEALAEALENGEDDAMASLPRARREMIERVIALDEKRIRDVMTPRADIVALDVATPTDEAVAIFADAGHSRLPVFREDLDDPVGMVHLKDLVALIAKPDAEPAGDGPILDRIKRDVLYVPRSMRAVDLLLRMQASRIHMALVVDEFGGTDGLATIEDLVEEVVGEINDEHDDDDDPLIARAPGGGWIADARVELDDFSEATGVVIEAGDHDDEVDTLGGLVFTLAGRVPQRGEIVSHPDGLDFEVTEADPRKIRQIRVCARVAGAGPQAAAREAAPSDDGVPAADAGSADDAAATRLVNAAE